MVDQAQFSPVAQAPIAGVLVDHADITITVLPQAGVLTLRGERAVVGDAAAHCLGVASLPGAVGALTEGDGVTVYWVGPNEWQIVCALDAVVGCHQQLRTALEGRHHQLVDVSDYYLRIALKGKHSRTVLAKHVPANLSAEAFAVGSVLATRFAKGSTLLHADSEQSVVMQARWSYAPYVAELLRESSLEYAAS